MQVEGRCGRLGEEEVCLNSGHSTVLLVVFASHLIFSVLSLSATRGSVEEVQIPFTGKGLGSSNLDCSA